MSDSCQTAEQYEMRYSKAVLQFNTLEEFDSRLVGLEEVLSSGGRVCSGGVDHVGCCYAVESNAFGRQTLCDDAASRNWPDASPSAEKRG